MPRTGTIAAAALAAIAACGGDSAPAGYATYAEKCLTPRAMSNDTKGTLDDEKQWLRGWIDDLYLWYREVPDVNAAQYTTTATYFAALKTAAITPSGKPKDQFHFTMATADFEAQQQSGLTFGYGAQIFVLASRPPRRAVVAYTEPGSPADLAGVKRGDDIVSIDGADLVNGNDVTTLNAGLSPKAIGESHIFVLKAAGGDATRSVTLVSANVVESPVQNVATLPTATGPVGYLTFNSHIVTAEVALRDAFLQLKDAGVSDLVVDMRYNLGGILLVASELDFMIAGPTRTAGKTFERSQYNDKHPGPSDPVSGDPVAMPFFTTTALQNQKQLALPSLGLSRVFILTSALTCSASESVINGLRGVDVEVILIGDTTCGKPYAFFPTDNCGTTYFAIQSEGVNEKGFGDYADGFVPGGTGATGVPGCAVADDYKHPLGDPAEAELAAALAYRQSGSCPVATGEVRAKATTPAEREPIGVPMLDRSPWRGERILVPVPR